MPTVSQMEDARDEIARQERKAREIEAMFEFLPRAIVGLLLAIVLALHAPAFIADISTAFINPSAMLTDG